MVCAELNDKGFDQTFSRGMQDWQVGDEKPLLAGPQLDQQITAMTMVCVASTCGYVLKSNKVYDNAVYTF